MELGHSGDTNELIEQIADATDLAAGDWWDAANSPAGGAQVAASALDVTLSADVILTIGGTAITDGTLIFDVWYLPATDGATLTAS